MLTVILGFSGAVVFGSADFLGGLASKRLGSMKVTALAGFVGFLTLLLASVWIPGTMDSGAIFWGVLSGVSGSVAIMLLYASLAIGPMSILSPLGALVSAVVPVAWAGIRGEVLGPLGYVAIAIGFVAIVLVGFVPDKMAVRPSLRGLAMAAGAGIFIGFFIICIDQVNPDTGLIPLLANRATSFTIMTMAIGVMAALHWTHRRGLLGQGRMGRDGPARADIAVGEAAVGKPGATNLRFNNLRIGLLLAIACGVVDAIGNALLLFGIHIGDLSVMSVLTAMYPIGTIILAGVILKERITPLQLVGLALAISAAALLALS
ncbi:DMT family transporter [Alpinimonas psychrophila]|uniref:Drug/metabolite transporter (DMT)-like permease n=1 Tax=Alpinimonas psychrophila TaxID=748908 RepID=A0A7W3JUN9_9MICO|nr:EamA family transporter [Alpinimonas psychrophila]MBA8829603.1 drug/metabolite transporter (DMT)-like permease [Alpinimonas psychrophila]MBA8830079.1 drug/metabolite transporter (DMT)-like permease [Alpinimonas psychrophila]